VAEQIGAGKEWWQSSESDEWETPQWLFDLLNIEIGFELDVCATEANHKCPRYFTREQAALQQAWVGRCWMNPPYGRSGGVSIYQWLEKAYASARQGATVACLIPARTDTTWWWDFCIQGEIRFLKGRIKWPNSSTIAPFPSAVVIFWPFIPENKAEVIWWDVKGELQDEQ
jgi:phage N-6-adenine-methyltransferase